MFPIINIGPFAVQAAGLILLLGFWIGTWLTGKFAENIGTNSEAIENSILFGLLGGILGARVGFFLQNPSIFIDKPLSLFSLTPTMFNVNFGILVGLLTVFIIEQKKSLPLWPSLDTITPLILFNFAGIHMANFANGNAYGLPTDLTWGIQLWGAERHPVQVYALLLTAVLIIWLFLQTNRLKSAGFLRSGVLFNLILTGIGAITVFTRAFVAEKSLLAGLDTIQILGFIGLTGGLILIYLRAFQSPGQFNVLISMGSNIQPEQNLSNAIKTIASEFTLKQKSSIYRTQDVINRENNRNFLNLVIKISTKMTFPELRMALKSIEKDFGREPGNKNVVPLDLDVLTYNDDVFTYQGKHIPDPNILKFRYIALPLAEISQDFHHPATGESIQRILEKITNNKDVVKLGEVENGTAE